MILSTYQWPRALSLTLRGYARQTRPTFELVIADDGSGPETKSVVEEARSNYGLHILHVWQKDRGFRKTEILNRAVLAASGDYLIFSDGDCIPREDFVAQHARLCRQGLFLSGGYLRLPAALSRDLREEDVDSGRAFHPRWLRGHGWKARRQELRLTRSPFLASLLDSVTTTRATWNGHNASTWRQAIFQVNGFDRDFGYGSEDRVLGERLRNLGLRGKQIRFRAPVVHLHHDRPYRNTQVMILNRERRLQVRRSGEVRSRNGLAQMEENTSEEPFKESRAHRPGFLPIGARPPGRC